MFACILSLVDVGQALGHLPSMKATRMQRDLQPDQRWHATVVAVVIILCPAVENLTLGLACVLFRDALDADSQMEAGDDERHWLQVRIGHSTLPTTPPSWIAM